MVSPFLFFFLLLCFSVNVTALNEDVWGVGPLVKKDQRRSLVSTEYGEISAVEISDETRRPYHLEFITLEPNSLFLPVLLHADMVFYVHTGSGKLSWTQEDEVLRVKLQRGDVYRLQPGIVFFVQSNLEPEREKLRISAIFADSNDDLHEPSIGAYSSISDLVRGFDKKVLQAAFKAPEEVIEAITNGTKSAAIVHAVPKQRRTLWEWEVTFINGLLGNKGCSISDVDNRRKKTRTFNILKADPDFENCNGKSLSVTRKDLHALRGSNIGVFLVNLTKGSMMGPHWNPMATEIAMVIQGQGMVRVVCSSSAKESECKNMRFRIAEGDVFAVPRFHPMAQLSFNNDSLVFVGFSTSTKKNHPQFLTGKASVLQALDKNVLAASFNVTNTTINQLLASQADSIILDCTSCAEEEERLMEEEIERERQKEEARKREEEEARRREEEKKREEEEAKKREEEEEEEARRRAEEKKREEEEAKKREEEEEARRREEEEEKRREEEEARRREEEKKREEEEAKKREEEEEEARRREEEEEKRREEEEARRREEEEEEEEEKRREEEEARKREEEEAKEEEEKRREEEEARKREEEEATKREEEEEEARRREEEEEEKRREEEAARRREEEEEKRREEEDEARRREKEEEEKRREEEEEEEEAARRREEEEKRREKAAEREQEEARKQEEEREQQEQEEEARREGGGGGGEGRRVLKKVWKV